MQAGGLPGDSVDEGEVAAEVPQPHSDPLATQQGNSHQQAFFAPRVGAEGIKLLPKCGVLGTELFQAAHFATRFGAEVNGHGPKGVAGAFGLVGLLVSGNSHFGGLPELLDSAAEFSHSRGGFGPKERTASVAGRLGVGSGFCPVDHF